MKKSALLEYLINYTDEYRISNKKESISIELFMICLFKVLEEYQSGQIPEALNNDVAIKEVHDVAALLKKYVLDYHKVLRNMLAAYDTIVENEFVDTLLFSRTRSSAEFEASRKGKTNTDLIDYLNAIIAQPTQFISDFILQNPESDVDSTEKEDYKNDEDASAEDREKALAAIMGRTSQKEKKETPKKNEKETDSGKKGIEWFSDIVHQTQEIQRFLLDNIFGQDQVVTSFVSGYFQSMLMAKARPDYCKPLATFLFAGPPGVGKTYLAEKAAEVLGLPFARFDMSEYSDKEAPLQFCGSDKVYRDGKEGNITGFVDRNPKCVLLFDEVEKAHYNIIYLFLQMLDAGRLRDSFTDKEVQFKQAIIIFTTNAGKNLYDDTSITNLSAVPRKKILQALGKDMNPVTGYPLFPAPICSRFSSGNVIMFNHLDAHNLLTIANHEFKNNVVGFKKSIGVKMNIDSKVPSAIMFSEGGKADARTIKGRANAFFHEELYELFRLLTSKKVALSVDEIEEIDISVSLDGAPVEISSMFTNNVESEILIFSDEKMATRCQKHLSKLSCHFADNIEEAKDILFNYDITLILCDVTAKPKQQGKKVLNAEDVDSVGHDFLTYALTKHSIPIYLIQNNKNDISQEEYLSFAKVGVRGILTINDEKNKFYEQVVLKCDNAYQQNNMLKLARENKLLTYKTSQTISEDCKKAEICLCNFRFHLATDVDDSKNILDNISRPTVKFNDVIGAEDAKKELTYFVEYLKDPRKFMRRGVRAPKGILLYGPPGTGKTLLAKAMAGESDVTFLTAEGNQFIKGTIGAGSEAVHNIFMSARKYAPSILFIDEIDAIAKDRQTQLIGSSTDILTAFLTEMDGFNTDSSKPVFVLAATNFDLDGDSVHKLDPALLRRFDRRIYIDLPTKEERKQYLQMKARQNRVINLSDEQVENIALRSTGMSLAELESVVEMALRNAIRSESNNVGDAEFDEAFETFNNGEATEWSKEMLERTARHEAGHALLYWKAGTVPSYLTIVSRGTHGGYMQLNEDKGLYTKAELLSQVGIALGGRASEIVYYGEEEGASTGAGNDLYKATRIIEQMICHYGMDSSVGMSFIGDKTAPSAYSDQVRTKVNEILQQELNKTIEIISQNKDIIDCLVEKLLEKNHLKENEMLKIFDEFKNRK